MIRLLFLLHRYLGIAVGALMLMWCASGVVMMYVGYPTLDESARLEKLEALDWRQCCRVDAATAAEVPPVGGAQIEMLAGRPVLLVRSAADSRLIDLSSGALIKRVSPLEAAATAQRFVAENSMAPLLLDLIRDDQWTVAGDFAKDRPLYRFALRDTAGSEIYVSSTTGRAVQRTTRRARFWNWVGAVPHWLYFSQLRRHAALWNWIVVYTALIGCFLAGLGLFIGIRQLRDQPKGRWSPYQGMNLWHHYAGLMFGIFALTWVFSGLLSMNPWGWLQGAGAEAERAALRGPPASLARIDVAVQAIADNLSAADLVSLEAAPFNGQLFFVAHDVGGVRRRLDAKGQIATLDTADLKFLGDALGSAGAATPRLIAAEDDFYFSHQAERAALPVYRVLRGKGSATRYYVDPVSGLLIAKIDAGAQYYRWFHQGLHRMDFTAALRSRPVWDILMLLLMSGVTAVCATGAYLGYRRVVRSAGGSAFKS
jgi:uncharacterized iron-regulated membrane protein